MTKEEKRLIIFNALMERQNKLKEDFLTFKMQAYTVSRSSIEFTFKQIDEIETIIRLDYSDLIDNVIPF